MSIRTQKSSGKGSTRILSRFPKANSSLQGSLQASDGFCKKGASFGRNPFFRTASGFRAVRQSSTQTAPKPKPLASFQCFGFQAVPRSKDSSPPFSSQRAADKRLETAQHKMHNVVKCPHPRTANTEPHIRPGNLTSQNPNRTFQRNDNDTETP